MTLSCLTLKKSLPWLFYLLYTVCLLWIGKILYCIVKVDCFFRTFRLMLRINIDGLADMNCLSRFSLESISKKSFLANSTYLSVVFFWKSGVLLNKITEKPFLDDSMHNLVDLSSLLNDFSLLDLIIVHVDMGTIIVHGNVVDPIRVYLGAALS